MMRMTNGISTVPHSAPSITSVALPFLPVRRNRTPTTEAPTGTVRSDSTT